MGCGASKNDVIKSASSGNEPKVKGGAANGDTKVNGSTIPASEKFGNGSAGTAGNNNGNNNDISGGVSVGGSSSNRNLPELPPLKPPRTSKVGFLDQTETMDGSRHTPVAFEVPAEEDASLIKKHPPRRLRQLEERPTEATSVTQEALEEKVALANERRNQVLHQRVASARTKSARAGGRVRRTPLDSELESSETRENGLELEGNEGE
ncbi:unnamed protein product [Orchesella dallaii]|uniref:Uncharacterized protein n=1 Tax=Orchesella dallaii TaxID=48710 RepID=A0ABP1QJM4_9HEXA